jgi:filamentous hemagglutinin family protein
LFHSFENFNVPDHNIANFLNDTGLATTNILGRVTGGNVSNIFGTIQTIGFGNANLFLMNPAGIVFGPTASLNVGGSVTFTTADYLRLADNGRFNAIQNATADALLSTAPVVAYGFLGSNPGAITVQGSQLTVSEGQGISLVGGNTTIQNGILESGTAQPARLSAPNGQINLASAKSPGEFLKNLLVESDGPSAANINGASFTSFGAIQLTSGSTVDLSQTENGKISVRGSQLVLEVKNAVLDTANTASSTVITPGQDIIVLAPKSSVISRTSSSDRGPDVSVRADRIMIVGIPGSALDFDSLPFTRITTNTQGAGNAGNITLQATGNIETKNVVSLASFSGSNLDGTKPSPTLAQGNAGNVELTSLHGDILMTNGGRVTQVASQTDHSSGNTGNVTALASGGDIVLDGASLLTLSSGNGRAGHVEITAKNLWMKAGLLSNESVTTLIKPGGITVTLSGTLTMAADFSVPTPIPPYSFIVTSAFSPNGASAGDITLTAKDIVATQGSLISSETFASGPGGQLKIFADTLQLTDGSQIKSGSTFAPPFGRLPQGIVPSGPGGTITITGQEGSTRSVLIDGAGSKIVSDSNGTGVGGNIFVSANSVTLQNGASISASSTGSGNAGNIWLNAGQRLMVRDSFITTEAKKAGGGNIDVIAIDRIHLANGRISTSVLEGSGDSGKIFIDPNQVVVQNNSTILTQAVHGHGGDITITTPRYLQDLTSLVDASSQFGQSGRVSIQSSTSNLRGTVAQLASKPSEAQALLQNRCVALAGGEQSTFIVAGRDTLPLEPGGWLNSALSMDHLRGHEGEHAAGPTAKSAIGVPMRETQPLSLRRLTLPGFLVRTFATGPTGCPS